MKRSGLVAVVCAMAMLPVATGTLVTTAAASAPSIATVLTGTTPLRGNAVDTVGHVWAPYARTVFSGPTRLYVEVDVARQVSGPGSGCALTTWTCAGVDQDANASEISIAASPDGSVWIAFYAVNKQGRSELKAAHYVGSGGTGCTSGQWSCEIVVVDPGFFHSETAPSIAVLSDGTPVVAYETGPKSKPLTSIALARRAPGSGCADSDWTCTKVDHANTGYTGFPAIAAQASGETDIAYLGTGGSIWVARSSSGAPATGWCAAGFDCERLHAAFDPSAFFPSITMTVGPHSRLWLAFPIYDAGNATSAVGVASQAANARWKIERVDDWSAAFALNYASVAFDALGHPVVAYQDASFRTLRVAERSGAGTGCTTLTAPGWACSTIDSDPGGLIGAFPAIQRSGATLVVTYGAETASGEELRIATL